MQKTSVFFISSFLLVEEFTNLLYYSPSIIRSYESQFRTIFSRLDHELQITSSPRWASR